MRSPFAFLCVTAMALAAVGLSAGPQNSSKVQDERELRNIESQLGKLEQSNDSTIAKFLADDWIALGPHNVLTKSDFQKNISDNYTSHGNGPSPYTIEKRNLRVDLFGDTAVATYIKVYRQTPDTTKFFEEDDTDVFTRTPKGWQLRLTKISPVPPKTNPS